MQTTKCHDKCRTAYLKSAYLLICWSKGCCGGSGGYRQWETGSGETGGGGGGGRSGGRQTKIKLLNDFEEGGTCKHLTAGSSESAYQDVVDIFNDLLKHRPEATAGCLHLAQV